MGLVSALAGALLALAAPGGVAVKHDLAFAAGPRGKLDIYLPAKPAPGAPIAVFIYGGSWQSGDKGFYRFVGATLASRGILTVIPDYRVYPEVRYPDFLRDNALAVRFVEEHAGEWGGDPAKLFLIGHSAGAYNVAMLAIDRRWLGEVGLDPRRDVAGVVGLAGPYDFLPLRDEKLKIIFGPKETRPDTQPINHVDGQAPPMLLLAGSKDTVVDPGNSTRLAAAVEARGGEAEARLFPGVGHVGLLTAILAPFRHRAPTLQAIVDFVTVHSAAAVGPAASAKAAA
ncbi:MAG: alpha/beta hydrolase [Pseudomonadota bacterium]|nr:alpha/beta hydrolase [Pseudomonadota bacterium]